MAPPALTTEQRVEALEKAKAARAVRAKLKDDLRTGAVTFAQVLRIASTEPNGTVGRTRVTAVLLARPGVGTVRMAKILDDAGIAANRRLRGLGKHQTAALIAEFSGRGSGSSIDRR